MEKQLQDKARELLESGKADVIIGYGWNRDKSHTTPVFIKKAEDVGKLVFNKLCVNNLSVYLTRKYPDVYAMGKRAIVAKGCDIKNIVVMMSEGQLKRDEVHIIGVTCDGVIFDQDAWPKAEDGSADMGAELKDAVTATKCHNCDVRNPHLTDTLIGDKSNFTPPDEPVGFVFDKIKDIEKMDSRDKWQFWMGHFSRCIKCYACRQVCSLCYCERCISDKNMPQWIETSAHLRGNLAWNLIRAQHLTGRCTFCGECERACPANIPLNVINQKMSLVMGEAFDYKSGYDPKEHPPMIVFNPDEDKDDFIK